jgi:acetyl-CoA carboxylase, biotin carboxylase subunit
MIKRLFIANRGEIALRVIRTARRMGLTSILGCSEADRNSLPARLADESVVIGPASSAQSYLSIERILKAAKDTRASAIHPGYGFLSENAQFAQAVRAAGVVFVGPDAASLTAMGDKLKARAVAAAAGLPVVPGGSGATREDLQARARETGYPLLLKAVAGGGGRGMKRVDRAEELDEQTNMAMAEARAAFGDPRIYVERYIAEGRHVEVQLLGDGRRTVHLGTRDCSIQRRFQKLVEEAPAPGIPEARLAAIHAAAVTLGQCLHYRGAGTVEFLVDARTFEFYFLEMNARIQVEHPVTESVTGLDLIEQQLLIADGQLLGFTQDQILIQGHAIEVRINAEDWSANFRPSPGRITSAKWPAGRDIRMDTHICSGETVSPRYDSLLGKLIVTGPDRSATVNRLREALGSIEIIGVSTTTDLHRAILSDERFINANVTTRFFEGLQRG